MAADPYVGVAESPYGDIPDDANAPSARVAGPYYLVRVRANGVTFAIIAVSAFATDLAIVSGRIQTPETYGNEFRTRVVGKDGSNSVLTGEEAVARAYEAFGEPIAEPPRLIRAGREFFPQVASWRIRLAAPVRARLASSGEAITSDVIYIDHSGAFRVPSETQPQSSFRYVATDGQTKLAELPIREDLAVAFATITPR